MAVPAVTPVTRPDPSTVATDEAPLVHVPDGVVSPSAVVPPAEQAVKVPVIAAGADGAVVLIDIVPVIVAVAVQPVAVLFATTV